MCGFVGLYLNNNYNIEVRKLVSILNNMTNTLAHRGPDHKDIYVNEKEKLALVSKIKYYRFKKFS